MGNVEPGIALRAEQCCQKAAEKWPDTRGPAKNGKVVFDMMDSWARLENRPTGWAEAMVPSTANGRRCKTASSPLVKW